MHVIDANILRHRVYICLQKIRRYSGVYCKEAVVATNWWIKQIKKQYKKLNPTKIIGNSPNFTILDDSFLQELSRFQEVLIREIHEHVENNRYMNLNCLHFPGSELSKIVKKAQFTEAYLPLHIGAEMEITGKSIEVSLGKQELHPLNISDEL